ncbi:hypothetical protein KTS45_12440 [Halomicroarcula limicola]|uniref:Small CPxCG-related zinc finger protein n=1 Tax=Haloarcula limicola TaxID=1429915 RepID=A0A8J7Y5A6_9EURY|nr:hypothetical protein [Halomicroarcula limicola]MBV0925005.1 hypothetical protein [Halomicroarcula limicola]
MPSCDNCGAHVSADYHRVRAGNDGKLRACPDCTNPATRQRDAAGVSSAYAVRSDERGQSIATDGGDDT